MAKKQQKTEPPKSLDERMMDLLPPPPRPFSEQSDDDIEFYLRRVADVGGIEGLTWFYRPENFNPVFGPAKRMRLQHVYGGLLRKIDEEAKRKLEREAAERAEQLRIEDREARKQRAGHD